MNKCDLAMFRGQVALSQCTPCKIPDASLVIWLILHLVLQGDSVSKNFEVLKAKAILARRCHIFKKGEGGLSPEVPYF